MMPFSNFFGSLPIRFNHIGLIVRPIRLRLHAHSVCCVCLRICGKALQIVQNDFLFFEDTLAHMLEL